VEGLRWADPSEGVYYYAFTINPELEKATFVTVEGENE
jgi:hypothetical protein